MLNVWRNEQMALLPTPIPITTPKHWAPNIFDLTINGAPPYTSEAGATMGKNVRYNLETRPNVTPITTPNLPAYIRLAIGVAQWG